MGIYYNLSIWYKLTNKNIYGAYITIAGAIITILLNVTLIPHLHYAGAAIATFCCYFLMMVISYKLGQKFYPVPYSVKKLSLYIFTAVALYLIHWMVTLWVPGSLLFSIIAGILLLAVFTRLIGFTEAKDLVKLPVVGRFYKQKA